MALFHCIGARPIVFAAGLQSAITKRLTTPCGWLLFYANDMNRPSLCENALIA